MKAWALQFNRCCTRNRWGTREKGEIQYPNTGIGIKNVSDLMPYERNLLKVPEDVQNGIVVEKLKENGLGKNQV